MRTNLRLATKTTDVNWLKEKDLDIVNGRYTDKQFKFLNPGFWLSRMLPSTARQQNLPLTAAFWKAKNIGIEGQTNLHPMQWKINLVVYPN